MDPVRQLVSDVLALQGLSKVAAANFADVKPSALSHWLNGKPAISHEKLGQIYSGLGLKGLGNELFFRDNQELLAPRIWRAEDDVMDAVIRCMALATEQYGEILVGLPSDQRGAAILFSRDGRWGAVQRCNPLLLIGHRVNAASVGAGVIQRILDGDVKALIDSCNALAMTGQVNLAALDIAGSLRQPERIKSADAFASQHDPAKFLLQWAEVCAHATRAGLHADLATQVLKRFSELSPAEQSRFLSSR